MKVETRLIIGLVSAVLVFLYEWLFKNTLDWYPSIVAFAVVYFIAPLCFHPFFFPRKSSGAKPERSK